MHQGETSQYCDERLSFYSTLSRTNTVQLFVLSALWAYKILSDEQLRTTITIRLKAERDEQ